MKHHHINKDKIYEAFVREPYELSDYLLPFEPDVAHGWQVILVVGYTGVKSINIAIDMDTESQCIDFVKSLNLYPIPQKTTEQ